MAVARVHERVLLGGHTVPEDVVRRRYIGGLRNFFTIYRAIADDWQLFDNRWRWEPILIASGGAGDPSQIIYDEQAWSAAGMGEVSTDIEPVSNHDNPSRDIPRIQRALALAVRDALRVHKRAGNPVAEWRDGRVVWIPPEEIPVDDEPEH